MHSARVSMGKTSLAVRYAAEAPAEAKKKMMQPISSRCRGSKGRLAPGVGQTVDEVEAVQGLGDVVVDVGPHELDEEVGVEAVEGVAAVPGAGAQRGLQLGDDVLRVEQLDAGRGVVARLLGGDRAPAVQGEPVVEHEPAAGQGWRSRRNVEVGGGGGVGHEGAVLSFPRS